MHADGHLYAYSTAIAFPTAYNAFANALTSTSSASAGRNSNTILRELFAISLSHADVISRIPPP
eukprot:CAMPEP_0113869382 /NCGR_PEP_ID=MMETSP0780_2-20120614/1506_1 /TAXON_ID=652834 /ORGANISM="Palpitomonas bilix" /LENGTH=63 /DNA_ID=CAMNT_0000854555 /DNA_START=41 /DNA_END=228 /DNA_ORIENTATION=- /assembly_acc=CAM_ASM_000599